MASILVCAVPLDGHVTPLLAVARLLASAGHRVRFLTGAAYHDQIQAAGIDHVALPVDSDVSSQVLDAGRKRDGKRLHGIAAAIENTRRTMIDTIPGWSAAITAQHRAGAADVVVAEWTVFALGGLCALPRADRPAVVAIGIAPVVLLSIDAAPPMMGLPPRDDSLGRLRNRVLNAVVTRVVFRGLHRRADASLKAAIGVGLPVFLTDWVRTADAFVQLSVASFEYPRRDAPANLAFVGPLPPPRGAPRPTWWGDLDDAHTVVHVCQGTLANRDFEELVLPALRALAEDDALVVVSTGGRPVTDLGPLPRNARAAEFVDYNELMPRVDVFVTNGGYGSLGAALAHGVPIVVAGDTEDKIETAARVGWSGVGVDLRTGTPTEAQIRDAVNAVRDDPGYRARARRIQADIAAAPGEAGVLDAVGRVLAAV